MERRQNRSLGGCIFNAQLSVVVVHLIPLLPDRRDVRFLDGSEIGQQVVDGVRQRAIAQVRVVPGRDPRIGVA